jgi:NADP-dependent 3-hydroxy acid dehydrogenase YdfG
MKLEKKNAVIYGAGGSIGSGVAKAFAREGAKVFLTGRNLASVAATAGEIIAAGGTAEAAQVDALDEGAVEGHIAAVVEKAGTVDISFNAIITAYMRSYFLTARAAARRMVETRSGVILIHTPEPARLGAPPSPCPSQGSPKTFCAAIVDEIEWPRHIQRRFTVGS